MPGSEFGYGEGWVEGEGEAGGEGLGGGFDHGGKGDHGGVVAGEGGWGDLEGNAEAVGFPTDAGGEAVVVGDAAGEANAAAFSGSSDLVEFASELIDDGGLKGGADVGEGGFEGGVVELFEGVAEAGFEPGKAETPVGGILEGAGKVPGRGVAVGSPSLDLGAAGVGQSEEFGTLVESLAGGIVDRFGEDRKVALSVDPDEEGVAAGNNQSEVGELGSKVFRKVGRVFGVERNEGGEGVGAEVVDPVEGYIPVEGEGLRGGDPDRKTASESGAAGDGNGFDLRKIEFLSEPLEKGGEVFEVFAGGEFGNDSAVDPVEIDLGVGAGIENPGPRIEKGDARFVTGGFDAENHWAFRIISRAAVRTSSFVGGNPNSASNAPGSIPEKVRLSSAW